MDMKVGENPGKELNNLWMNFINFLLETWTSMQYNDLLPV